jgi:hypothetical protein
MNYLNIFLLALIVVYVVDVSGIVESLKEAIGKVLRIKVGRLRPLDCSLCMVWWVCLIYAICVGSLSIPMLAYISLLSFLAIRLADLMRLVSDIIGAIIEKINKHL